MDDPFALVRTVADLYRAINTQDAAAVLAAVTPDVEWAGVRGRAELEAYWRGQWEAMDVHLEPGDLKVLADGRARVVVHQIVRDRRGGLLADGDVTHVLRFEDGLLASLEVV